MSQTAVKCYVYTWDELLAAAERRDCITDIQGHILCSRDRAFDQRRVRDYYHTSVAQAIARGFDVPDAVRAAYEQRIVANGLDPIHARFVAWAPAGMSKEDFLKQDTKVVSLCDNRLTTDTRPKNAKGKPFSWSYTALAAFEKCPASYAAERFYCTAPFQETEAIRWGNRVHSAGEVFVRDGVVTDLEAFKEVEKYAKLFRSLKDNGADVQPELEITLTQDMQPTGWFSKDAWFRIKLDVPVIQQGVKAGIYDYKGLALDTVLPTPAGWTTMRDVCTGDFVLGSDGRPCQVVGKSHEKNIRCFKVRFDDNSEIVCDEEHLWTVAHGQADRLKTEVLQATEVRQKVLDGHICRVAVAQPLELPLVELPVHPYVLGVWLGDGKHTSGEVCKPDDELFEHIESCGYKMGANIGGKDRCQSRTVYGLSKELRKAGILANKHIPKIYLRSAKTQRLALLQGLFDTDGHWNPLRKQAILTTVDAEFARQIFELLCTLGQRPRLFTVTKRGFGKVLTGYDVVFTPVGLNPFRLKRKGDGVDPNGHSPRPTQRVVKEILEVESVTTQCIEVNSPNRMYLCGEAMIPTHNTGGKIRDDQDQLKLCSASLGLIRPELETFTPKLIWTKHQTVTGCSPEVIPKAHLPAIWEDFLARVDRIQKAWQSETFPARSGPLCPWCSQYQTCAYARRR